MKELAAKLAVLLYAWSGRSEAALAREALSAVPPIRDYVEHLSPADRLKFFAEVSAVLKNEPFMDVMSFLSDAQTQAIAKHATPETLSFHRGTLNGVKLVLDEVRRMEARAAKERSDPQFDQFKAI